MNETVNIMLVSDRKYLGQMRIMLYSLFETNPRPIRVFLFHSELTEKELRGVDSYIRHWPNKEFVPIHLTDRELEGLPTSELFPKEVYFKFLALRNIPIEIKKVICMDIDMVVQKPMDALFDLEMGEIPLAACMDIYGYVYGECDLSIRRLGLAPEHIYFNSGLLCYNLEVIRKLNTVEDLLKTAREHKDHLKWWEQDVLNLYFDKKCALLPWHLFNCPPVRYVIKIEDANRGELNPLYQKDLISDNFSGEGYADYTEAIRDLACVIHYIGETKPWKADRMASETYRIFDEPYERIVNAKPGETG